jgi:hypothetical protein
LRIFTRIEERGAEREKDREGERRTKIRADQGRERGDREI